MPVDPEMLHPISHYFPATQPSFAAGQGTKPGVPIPQGLFSPPDYETEQPEILVDKQESSTSAPVENSHDSSFGKQRLPFPPMNGLSFPALASTNSYQLPFDPQQQQQHQQQQQQHRQRAGLSQFLSQGQQRPYPVVPFPQQQQQILSGPETHVSL